MKYLLDTDTFAYPERIFVGDSVPDIPYIKINVCENSELHDLAIAKERETTENIQTQAYTLYDMVFPNPDGEEKFGLYSDVIQKLHNSNQEWKTKVGPWWQVGAKLEATRFSP